MNIEKGDILIDRKTMKSYPVLDFINGHAYLELGHRLAKRSLGQIMKHKKSFIHLKKGDKLINDLIFYCPKTNTMKVLKAGTLFLGEL
jgi:hypothetical protein